MPTNPKGNRLSPEGLCGALAARLLAAKNSQRKTGLGTQNSPRSEQKEKRHS